MRGSVCAARPFTDQCINACCFEYQTRLWLAPPGAAELPHVVTLATPGLRAAVAPFNSTPPPTACKIYDCDEKEKKHKRRAGSSSVSQSRYRFSNPTLLYPQTLFSCVTVAGGVRGEGEQRERLKCSCLARVYFHPARHSKRASFCCWRREQTPGAQLGRLSPGGVLQRRPSYPTCAGYRWRRGPSFLEL